MKVVLADDHHLLVEALAHLFARICDGAEVLRASSLDEAMAAIEQHGPAELVLLDYGMPGMNGFAGLERFREAYPEQRVALISGHTDRAIMSGALDRGAVGFIPKTMTAEAMSLAIKLMLAGERFVPSGLFGAGGEADGSIPDNGEMDSQRPATVSRPANPDLPNLPGGLVEELGLSKRESEVLNCLVEGHSNREIGNQLGVEEVTIKLHLRRIYSKMDVRNRAQAVRMVLSQT